MNETNTSLSQNGETALRELALRLLAPRFPGMAPADEIRLFPGQLPPDLPRQRGRRLERSVLRPAAA